MSIIDDLDGYPTCPVEIILSILDVITYFAEHEETVDEIAVHVALFYHKVPMMT